MYAWLVAVAITLTGYAPPPRLPRVEVVPSAWFHCSAGPRCTLRMATRDGVVYVDQRMDLASPRGEALLLHEMVHVLQEHSLGPARSCAERLRREREAYQVQAIWLARRGVGDRVNIAGALRGYACAGRRPGRRWHADPR